MYLAKSPSCSNKPAYSGEAAITPSGAQSHDAGCLGTVVSVQIIPRLREKIPDILEPRWRIDVDAAASEPWQT